MKTLLTLIILLFLVTKNYAQICISYDAAGNRISRQGGCYTVPDPGGNINSTQSPVGRQIQNTIIEKLEISLFPNPSTGIFTIKSNQDLFGSNLTVIDIQGKVVLKEKLYDYSIDLSSYPVGVYQVVLVVGNEIKKFLVEKIE